MFFMGSKDRRVIPNEKAFVKGILTLFQMEFGIWDWELEICPMFTGIVDTQGIIKKITEKGTNRTFWIKSPISSKLKPDQSVAHDGVCLTIEEIKGNRHKVTAIAETIAKTNMDQWKEGSQINLEKCLRVNDRLDGHFVQGHVDTVAVCIDKKEKDGSWE